MATELYSPEDDYILERYKTHKEEREKLRAKYSEIQDRRLEKAARELGELIESTNIGKGLNQ